MFKIVRDGNFDGMYDSDKKPIDIFLNVLNGYNNTEFLFWFPQEFISKPFNLYNPLDKNKDILDLEMSFFQNQNRMSVLYGGMDGCDVYERLKLYGVQNLDFIYWPTFLLHYTKYNMEEKLNRKIEDIDIDTDFRNLFIFLNNKPKKHRAMVLDLLVKNKILDRGIFSWREKLNWWSENYEFKFWNEQIVDIDIEQKQYYKYEYDFITDKVLNFKCFINIIGESINFNDSLFITEKTYKSILTSQPFICIGSQYQNMSLKLLGFELYDEIFDYTFDTDLNLENRVHGVLNNIKPLIDKDYKILYNKIKDKVKFNKQRALDLIHKDIYIPKKLIDLYKNNKETFDFNIDKGIIPKYFGNIMLNV